MTNRSLFRNLAVLALLGLGATFLCSAGWLNAAPGVQMTAGNVAALHTPDFYLFAQKQAELYRGELLTRSEMDKLIRQLQAQVGVLPILVKLRANPYDLDAVQAVLQNTTKGDTGRLTPLVLSLKTHYARLMTTAEAYQN